MNWNDVTIGTKLGNDEVTQRHQTHQYDCYKMTYIDNNKEKTFIASKDHIFKVHIHHLPKPAQTYIKEQCNGSIPLREDSIINVLGYITEEQRLLVYSYVAGTVDKSVFFKVEDISESTVECYLIWFKDGTYREVFVKRIPLEEESQKIDEFTYWIPLEGLFWLYNTFGNLQISDSLVITNIIDVGKKDCFCVSTTSGEYTTNGLTSHNSVALQNLILHCIEHRDKIALALLDIKMVEFSMYKNMNGIVGVANSVRESCELARIAKVCMYARNKEMAALGIKNLTDYIPSQRSGKVYVTGRDYDEDDFIDVRIDNKEKSIAAKDLVLLLNEEYDIAEVRLNGKDWIVVNNNCVDFIYKDEMQILVMIVDELAELSGKSGLKTAEAKEEDNLRDEIMSILTSIAQLGRSAGILVQLSTQRPKAEIIPTQLRGNLGFRVFCGTASDQGASMVALDNTLATTIDSTHKGAAIVQSEGKPVFARVYFSKFSDLEDYYEKRGLDSLGYGPEDNKTFEELLELKDEVLEFKKESIEFEFEDEKRVIDKNHDQTWNEL